MKPQEFTRKNRIFKSQPNPKRDGSDVFTVEETYPVLVSEKFAEMVRRKRMRGLTLIPATEWRDEWAYYDPPPPAPEEDVGPVIKVLREQECQKREAQGK